MLGSSIKKAHSALKSGSILPSELLENSISKAEHLQPILNAATVILNDLAKKQAIDSDNRYKVGGPLSMIDGLPIVVKDNFCLAGAPTTCGSKMLQNFIPKYNATVVEKTHEAGGVSLAKSNMDEFGMGSGSVDSCFGPVKSIWRSGIDYKLLTNHNNLNEIHSAQNVGSVLNKNDFHIETNFDDKIGSIIAGGSSGGSASLVASGVAFAALGSDTGGSVRIPGSWSGLVSLKPSYGHISRHGLIPLVNSLDVPGILARSVEDVAIYYDLLKGIDINDSTTTNIPMSEIHDILKNDINPTSFKIGVPKDYLCDGMTDEVQETWSDIIDLLERNKFNVCQTSLPHTPYSISCYQVLNPCEVASNMARYDGLEYGLRTEKEDSTESLFASVRHYGFNDVVRGRILAGNYFLLRQNYKKYFLRALQVRRKIAEDFENAFKKCNLLVTPATLCDAPSMQDFLSSDNRTQTAKHDYCTQPVNLAGLPAATLPVKLSSRSLPLCIQIIGRYGREDEVLSLAKFIEDTVQFPRMQLI